MEKFPSQADNQAKELFLKQYPASENLKDKIGLAMELKQLASAIVENPVEDECKKYNAMADFANSLRTKHEDAEDYYLYHLLIGSTPSKEHPPKKFDFDGDDSIENFLRSKTRENLEK